MQKFFYINYNMQANDACGSGKNLRLKSFYERFLKWKPGEHVRRRHFTINFKFVTQIDNELVG